MNLTLNTSDHAIGESPKRHIVPKTLQTKYDESGQVSGFKEIPEDKSSDYLLAQSILGVDFITPEEMSLANSSVVFDRETILTLVQTLPPFKVLEWCKQNDFAVMPAPALSLSLLEVRELRCQHFYSKKGGWYDQERFANEDKTSPGWLMLKKSLVPHSTNKKWDEQNRLITSADFLPNVSEVVWFMTTYFEVRGIRLLENNYVLTSSIGKLGRRIHVGRFTRRGLYIDYHWHEDRRGDLGIVIGRKSH